MLNYIVTQDESMCCGCGACIEICPQTAISLKANREGFRYPVIDADKCVECKLCEKVCPKMNPPKKSEPLEIYAIQNKNADELFESSSGGAFRLVSDCIIQQGGAVVGCVWNETMEPVLTISDSMDGLRPMQGSKYLSSSTEHTYSQTKKLLDMGTIVLFTGTPCQCAGLLNFLRKPYDNLITMDFLCHGVPSQIAFNAYREALPGTVKDYRFRDKGKHGWGHTSSYLTNNCKKRVYSYGSTNSYDFAYLKGYLSRYSCYTCNFQGSEKAVDYTVCDFWGYRRFYDEIDTYGGVSAFQVNTQKGKEYMTRFAQNAWFHIVKREDVAVENPAIIQSHEENVPKLRKTIYQQIQLEGWKSIEKKYLRCKHFYLKKLWYLLPDDLTQMLKKMLKG